MQLIWSKTLDENLISETNAIKICISYLKVEFYIYILDIQLCIHNFHCECVSAILLMKFYVLLPKSFILQVNYVNFALVKYTKIFPIHFASNKMHQQL